MSAILLTLLVTVCCRAYGAEIGVRDATATDIAPLSQTVETVDKGPIEDAKTIETCKTFDDVDGVCVAYYNCEQPVEVETEPIIDIHIPYDPCESFLDVCCVQKKEEPTPDAGVKNQNNETEKKGCGYRNTDGVGLNTKVDFQHESKFGEFPWTVAILKIESTADGKPEELKQMYLGGGSLIHPSVVLTAAHVVRTENKLLVRAGDWDSVTTKEIYLHQEREVEDAVTHKNFSPKMLHHDVSLLFLKSPMDLAPNVGLACLPPQGYHTTHGQRCLVTGWPKDHFGDEGRLVNIQKKAEVPVVEHGVCETQLQKTRLRKAFRLHESFMCAGGEEGKDSCVAAGGSPLLCPLETYKNRYILSGMVAWSIGCGGDETPGAFVDVGSHRSWIDEEVARRGFDRQTYDVTVE